MIEKEAIYFRGNFHDCPLTSDLLRMFVVINRFDSVLSRRVLGPCALTYKKHFKDVSREFDEFQVKTRLCKLRCWYLLAIY